jgi:hypothetical protein
MEARTALRAHYVAVGDIDDDGDIDVLSASRNDDTIAWYANDGSGSFSTQIISNTFDDARTVTTVDIDADGDLDVVAGGNGASSISLFLNDGNPVPGFTESPVISGAGAINDLALILISLPPNRRLTVLPGMKTMAVKTSPDMK